MKNMFKKHGAMLILCLIFFGGIAVFFTAFYTNVKTETLKVMGIPAPRVSVSGSDGDTYSSCEYFVATDKECTRLSRTAFSIPTRSVCLKWDTPILCR